MRFRHTLILVALAVLAVSVAQAQDANIAFAATVTASPETDGSPLAAVDGNPATELTFAVGTAGEGTVTLTFDHARTVSGVRFHQASEAYYSTAYALEVDLDGSGQFAQVLATGDRLPLGQWVEHRWEPLSLRALRFRSVAGVSGGRRAHPCLGEIEVLGVAEAEDVAVATERGIFVPNVPAVRPLSRQTPMVVAGRGPAVLAPEGATYAGAAKELRRGLSASGPEAVTGIEQADPAHRTVVCLGNMLNNPLLARLYWNQYTYVDALTPGAGNYLLHVVHDPYPWNGGQDVVVIGCSDPKGAVAGVQAFLKHLRDGSLPYLVEGGPQPLLSAEAAGKIAAAQPNPTFSDFTAAVRGYLQTGCEAHAHQAVAVLDIMARLYAPGGPRSVVERSAEVLPWNEETTSFDIQCAWDAFEECPLLSDQQRLAATNCFLKFTRDLVSRCSDWASLGQDDTISWNHTTFPLLGIYGGARYFQRYYGLSDMPEKLAKARACFLAQARSWKPEEDSDSYVVLVPDHVATYCLAENELGYFTSGNLQRYADYLVGICDNRGLASGFGDSGVSSSPSIPLQHLPMALWWTGDGGYRWLMERYTNGAWKNPYEKGAKAVQPDRFTGVNVFPLDPQVYDFHQKHPSYNEKLVPSEVPAQQAFDKVSFRESWDPDAQYLLLDGFGRGKHLHYDTNAIIEFVEGSERWLLDHDYLVRNTTEHAMLTVLRNGRADTLVPSMAGLAATCDLPGLGYADTFVEGYGGCDWRRQVLWNRGEYFLVTDTVTAREAGSYDLELTWKTIDEAGHQRVADGCDFVAERGVGQAETVDCSLVDDPEASGGKALAMDRATSRIACGVDLPPGDYQLTIFARGVDGSSDSLWASTDLGPNQAFHAPQGHYAASSGTALTADPSPHVKLAGKGPHLLIVTLRENPPVTVDRFVFRNTAGQETTYKAESLPPAPQPDRDLGRSFHIKPAAPLQAWVTNHERIGISVPISVLHQRQAAELAPGRSLRFASLLYTSLPRHRRDLRPVQLQANLVAIQGSHPALALTGPAGSDRYTINAAAGWLTTERFTLTKLTRLDFGELRLAADQPVDLDLDLRTGAALLHGAAGTDLRLAVGDEERPYSLREGATRFAWHGAFPAAEAVRQVERLLTHGATPTTRAAAGGATEATLPVWTALEDAGQVGCLKVADLRDGRGSRVLVGRNGTLHCLDLSGQELWRFACQGPVRDVAWGDLRPNAGDEVLVGSADTYLYLLSAEGQLLEKKQMRGMPWARSFGDQAYAVWHVGIWDANGDGRNEVAVTLKNFDLQMLDAGLNVLWKNDYALHGSGQLDFVDTDLDGKPDTAFVGDHYGSVVAADGLGKKLFSVYTSIGDMVFAVGDVDGDGAVEVIGGSSTGDLVCSRYRDGEVLWRFDNFGYPVKRLRTADVNGDGRDEVIVASGTGYLYVLDGAGQVLWQDRAGLTVNDVLVQAEGPRRLVYADESGLLRLTTGAGEVIRDLHTVSPPRLLQMIPGTPLVLAALDSGQVAAYDLATE
jgi:outer membrane protein assembly factor BamB